MALGEIPITPQGPWYPVCDTCVGDEAIKTIGVYWPDGVRCNVCGEPAPHAHPVREEQLIRLHVKCAGWP